MLHTVTTDTSRVTSYPERKDFQCRIVSIGRDVGCWTLRPDFGPPCAELRCSSSSSSSIPLTSFISQRLCRTVADAVLAIFISPFCSLVQFDYYGLGMSQLLQGRRESKTLLQLPVFSFSSTYLFLQRFPRVPKSEKNLEGEKAMGS